MCLLSMAKSKQQQLHSDTPHIGKQPRTRGSLVNHIFILRPELGEYVSLF